MILKHASLQLNLHPRIKVLIYLCLKEKTGFFPRRESIKCISSPKSMVEKYGRLLIQKMTLMEVHQQCSLTVLLRFSPSTQLSTFVSKTVYIFLFKYSFRKEILFAGLEELFSAEIYDIFYGSRNVVLLALDSQK